MKRFLLFSLIIVSYIIINAEPYRPYPIILVHGYNTSNAKSSNFGLIMKKSLHYNDIAHPIEASPTQLKQFGELANPFDPKYYISKFKSDTLEENKLVFRYV